VSLSCLVFVLVHHRKWFKNSGKADLARERGKWPFLGRINYIRSKEEWIGYHEFCLEKERITENLTCRLTGWPSWPWKMCFSIWDRISFLMYGSWISEDFILWQVWWNCTRAQKGNQEWSCTWQQMHSLFSGTPYSQVYYIDKNHAFLSQFWSSCINLSDIVIVIKNSSVYCYIMRVCDCQTILSLPNVFYL
jgi:hypothetical protein